MKPVQPAGSNGGALFGLRVRSLASLRDQQRDEADPRVHSALVLSSVATVEWGGA